MARLSWKVEEEVVVGTGPWSYLTGNHARLLSSYSYFSCFYFLSNLPLLLLLPSREDCCEDRGQWVVFEGKRSQILSLDGNAGQVWERAWCWNVIIQSQVIQNVHQLPYFKGKLSILCSIIKSKLNHNTLIKQCYWWQWTNSKQISLPQRALLTDVISAQAEKFICHCPYYVLWFAIFRLQIDCCLWLHSPL